MSLSAGEIEVVLRLRDEASSLLKNAQANLKDFSATATEAGEKSGIFGGILDGVFGSWPAKVAEGVLLRDAVHELITVVKDGAVEFGLMGSEVNTLHEGMARLSGGVEQETAILNAMREGVKGTLNDVVLMTQANKLMATGALKNAADFGTLTEASRVLSREGFGSIAEVMGTVSNAMETGRGRRLALMGVTVDMKGSEEAYAKTLGLTSSELSTSQKLHADRMAIMEASRLIVERSGVQELNLKERIEATRVSIKNWTDDLAASIAASPRVTAAYDAIQTAIVNAFGGDAKALSAEFLEWINEAADAARTYGPVVVQWLKNTAEYIIEVWRSVEQAWDRVPEWFKNIARDAIIAGAAALVAKEGISLLAGSLKNAADAGSDSVGTMANLAQIWSVAAAPIKAFGGQIKLLGEMIAEFGAAGFVMTIQSWGAALEAATVGPLAGVISGMYAAATASGTMTASMAGMVLVAGAVVVALAAVAAVVTVGWQAWKLHQENVERAAAAVRQSAVDQANMERIVEQSGVQFKTLADAMAWAKQNGDDLRNGYTNLKTALDELKGSGAFLTDKLVTLVDTIKGMSAAGTLSTATLKIIAAALKETGVATKDLDPSLQAIVKAVEIMGAKAVDGEPKVSKFEQAVRAMMDAFEGDSKKIKENSEAIDRVVKSGNADIDVQVRLIDAIDQRIAKHLKLTAVQQTFYDANEALGKRAIAQQDRETKGWDQYYQEIAKNQGDSLAVQDAAIERWYDTQYDALVKGVANNTRAWEEMDGINAQYGAKLINAAANRVAAESKTAVAVEQTWDEYYVTVDRIDKESLTSQIGSVNKWYEASYAAIAAEAVNHEQAWDKLGPLNALFWAKLTKTRVDFETAATQKIMAAETALTDFVAQQTLTSTDFQVTKIWEVVNQQIAADVLSGKSDEKLNAKRLALAAAQVDALYIDNAALEKNSNESLRQTADRAATTYDEMAKAPGNYSKEAIAAQWQIYEAAERDAQGIKTTYGDVLTSLSAMFAQMGQLAGGSLGDVLTSFGKATISLKAANDQAEKGGGQFGRLSTVFGGTATKSAKMASAAAAAATIYQGAIAVWDATSKSASAAGNALGGMAAGAQAGAAFGPWGMAIGAAAGLVVGIIRGKPDWAKAADEVAKDFGVKISDSLAKTIADLAKSDFGGSRQAAAISQLSAIIKEAGGLSEKNLVQMTARLHDVFSMIETHQMTIAQGAKVLDENWSTFVAAATDGNGRISESLKEIIRLNDVVGTQSKEIAKWQAAQGAAALDSFVAVAGGAVDAAAGYATLRKAVTDASLAIEAAKKAGASQSELLRLTDAQTAALVALQKGAVGASQELDDLGLQAIASFTAAVAAGMPMGAALQKISPALDMLQKSYKDLGLDVNNVALKNLMMQNTIVKGNPALINAIAGLSGEMVTLDNLGLLNKDTFAAMERTGTTMFGRLLNAAIDATGGYDATTGAVKDMDGASRLALGQMQSFLQNAAEEAQKLGVPLDENTQRMIDQSKELGIWKEKGTDPLTDAMKTLVQKVGELVDAISGKLKPAIDGLGVPIPSPWGGWGNPPGIPDSRRGDGSGGGGDGDGGGGGAYTGAVVTANGLARYMARGGPVGTDTVGPIWATPGERILSVAQNRAYESGGVRGGGGGDDGSSSRGGATHQSFQIQVFMNGRHLADALVPEIPAVVKRYGLTK